MTRAFFTYLTILLLAAGCRKEQEQSQPAEPTVEKEAPRENSSVAPAEGADRAAKASPADQVVQAMKLSAQRQMPQAVEQLLKVNWSGEFRFSPDQHLFTLSEKKSASLRLSEREKIMAQVTEQLSQSRTLAKEAVKRGQDLKTSGKLQDAEAHDRAVLGLGRLLSRDPEGLLIVRLVGIAVQKLSLEELADLYGTMNESTKLQEVRKELRELNRQQEQIRSQTRK